ncbi:hypothetical protein ACYUJ6_02655 [Clostridium sp. JNZ X4-2]
MEKKYLRKHLPESSCTFNIMLNNADTWGGEKIPEKAPPGKQLLSYSVSTSEKISIGENSCREKPTAVVFFKDMY